MPPRSRTTLPLVQPIVPVLRGVPFDNPAWLFEPKYDGFRGLLYVGPRNCWFRSKRGNTMTRFQELAEQVRDELQVRSAILDGEIVSLDEEGTAHLPPDAGRPGPPALRRLRRPLAQRSGPDIAAAHPAEAAP